MVIDAIPFLSPSEPYITSMPVDGLFFLATCCTLVFDLEDGSDTFL
jgi:hypothetical protein